MDEELTRPIIGIENRSAQEVFDIMCDRITRALSPSPDGEVMRIQEWLEGVATDDLDEIVADGGITAGMVIQQEAREFARRLARRDPLSSSPVKTEREGPMCRCSEEARVNRLAARMGAKFVKREEGGDA